MKIHFLPCNDDEVVRDYILIEVYSPTYLLCGRTAMSLRIADCEAEKDYTFDMDPDVYEHMWKCGGSDVFLAQFSHPVRPENMMVTIQSQDHALNV